MNYYNSFPNRESCFIPDCPDYHIKLTIIFVVQVVQVVHTTSHDPYHIWGALKVCNAFFKGARNHQYISFQRIAYTQ